MYNTLLSNFHSIICQVVTFGRLKTKENFKLLALKVVTVAYKRWSLTRGSKYSDLRLLLQIFTGVLQRKIRMRAVLKETPTNSISIERL